MSVERPCPIEAICNLEEYGPCQRQVCIIREAMMPVSLEISQAVDVKVSEQHRRAGESLRRVLRIV